MPLLTIDWDDVCWELDTDEITLAQAHVIKDQTKDEQFPAGRNLNAWDLGLKNCEPSCVRAAYWLMRQQSGERFAISSIPDTFKVLRFHSAYADATVGALTDPVVLRGRIAEMEQQLDAARRVLAAAEAAQPDADAAADEAGPTTRPGTASRPSGTHGRQPAGSRLAASSPPPGPES